MITVYVWSFRGKNEAWGHAAMQCGAHYISWWPEDRGRVPSGMSRAAVQLLGARTPTALRSVYAASPIRNRTLADDELDEGNRQLGVRRRADRSILIDGLDESAIRDWWRGFGLDGGRLPGPLPAWHTTKRNCSTVVAQALQVGGGDRYSTWLRSWNVVWTPDDVREYAESIRAGIARARTRERR